ncbi:MAG: ABC transporter ATP-binding protein, partial [Anaerolineae bacterium]|nr:ABC transporter ATP-binding protein [Anaerolineae bacterium]
MNVWQATGKIIRHSPGIYTLALLNWTAIRFVPLIPGLITREIMDRLSGEAPAMADLWGLLALLVAIAAVRAGLLVLGQVTWPRFYFETFGLLQMNLLSRILNRPGARALPGSPGEAISR